MKIEIEIKLHKEEENELPKENNPVFKISKYINSYTYYELNKILKVNHRTIKSWNRY